MQKSQGLVTIPALVDLHVHLSGSGFSYKETIYSGTMAAGTAGYSDLFTMPNLNPVPDTLEHLQTQMDIIQRDAQVSVHPYASITMGQRGMGDLVDFETLAPYVAGFSDDGRGVQEEDTMLEAMRRCKAVDSIIVAHCEVDSLLRGGYIHEGRYAQMHGHRGICSESEWKEIERDIRLVEQTGCRFHVCHISTKESVSLIREAKRRGLPVTCETAPHYLLLTENDLRENGWWKMNPPLRGEADRDALIEGMLDGTIDVIATDHAPHSLEEKNRGLEKSAYGIVGLETAFPLMYTYFVDKGIITLDRLVELMSTNGRKIMGLGKPTEWVNFDVETEYVIDHHNFLSMGKAQPFDGWLVKGRRVQDAE
ncbi:MAG: dihydroorotase [Paludibacteraceae bacterium]|nr:dihydroorotase [Paludibacteraceae bacterium]